MEAWACQTAGGALAPFQYEPAPLGEFDCEIRITHCGLCHSDVHLIDDDWGITRYPMVPGHEIVGIVTAAGRAAGVVLIPLAFRLRSLSHRGPQPTAQRHAHP